MINETFFKIEHNKQELFIIRNFDAPRELVFKAFTTPEHLLQFHAPFGFTMKFDYANYVELGSYRWMHFDGDGNKLCTFKGVIHEMRAPDRLIQTCEMETGSQDGNAILEIFKFEEIANNNTRLTIQNICQSVEDRNLIAASGFKSGVESIFSNLDEQLIQKL